MEPANLRNALLAKAPISIGRKKIEDLAEKAAEVGMDNAPKAKMLTDVI